MPSTLEGTFNVQTLVPQSITLPASCVSKSNVVAGTGIEASKLQHLHSERVSQTNAAVNFTARYGLMIVVGATGTVLSFKARNTTTATDAHTTTIDLLKNGSSILSAVITLNAAATTVVQSATFASTSLVAGDVLEANIVATGAAPGQGLTVQLRAVEDY